MDEEPVTPWNEVIAAALVSVVLGFVALVWVSPAAGPNHWALYAGEFGPGMPSYWGWSLALLAAGLAFILVLRRWTRRRLGVVPIICVVPWTLVAGFAVTGMVVALGWFPGSGGWPIERSRVIELTSAQCLAQQGFAVTDRGHLPAGCLVDPRGEPIHGWPVQLLPFLEQENVYRNLDLRRAWTDPVNRRMFQLRLEPFDHPAPYHHDADGYVLNFYATNLHVIGGDRARKRADFDAVGTANVLLIGEAHGAYKAWGHPIQWRDPDLGLNASPHGFGTPFARGRTQFVMLDGSVRSFAVGDDEAFRRIAQGSRR